MKKKIKRFIGMALCDFGLYVLNLGPKDHIDRDNYKRLISEWKRFEAMK